MSTACLRETAAVRVQLQALFRTVIVCMHIHYRFVSLTFATLQVFALGPRSGAIVERKAATMVEHGNAKAVGSLLARARRGAENMEVIAPH
jgi:hypothetical protein